VRHARNGRGDGRRDAAGAAVGSAVHVGLKCEIGEKRRILARVAGRGKPRRSGEPARTCTDGFATAFGNGRVGVETTTKRRGSRAVRCRR
jgi:hypothetical protein